MLATTIGTSKFSSTEVLVTAKTNDSVIDRHWGAAGWGRLNLMVPSLSGIAYISISVVCEHDETNLPSAET